jgi:hypothetical protein
MSAVTIPSISPTAAEWSQAALPTCSLCLSVWYGDMWIGAEHAIHVLRTYAHWQPPRLTPGLCDECRGEISARRSGPRRAAA